MRCHRALTTERAWRLHLQVPHPAFKFALSPASTRSHAMAFAASPLNTFTPINSSPLHFQLSKSSYFIPSPPQSSPPHPPTPPPPLPLPHSCTDADADGAATAMARSSLLTATSNLNYTTSTVKTVEPTNNFTNTISSNAINFTSNSNSIAAQPTLHHEN
nr:hypothetical transcript [Hymenolepis microstoma]